MVSFFGVFSLRWKLIVSYLLLVASVLIVVLLVTRFTVRSIFLGYQETILQRQGEVLATLLGGAYAATNDWGAVTPQLGTWTRFTRGDVWILDAQGHLVATQPPTVPISEAPSSNTLKAALLGQVVHSTPPMFPSNDERAWVATPIRSGDAIVGVAYLSQGGLSLPSDANSVTPIGGPPGRPLGPSGDEGPLSFARAAEEFLSGVEQRMALAGVLIGAVAVLLGMVLARSIIRPLQSVIDTVEQIAAGDLAQRAKVSSRDEVGALAIAMNTMAERVQTQITELQRQETLRRDLIANVSHDLATPLTGIQGFTEALLDGMVLTEAERVDLFQSIFREVQRLRRLVGDLQDLSRFEDGLGHIVAQSLSLNQLVEEAVQVINPEAQDKQVLLVQRLPADLPLVDADGDRITQVLLNLVDNSLRYTPAGGSVTISATAHVRDVEVSVADTGSGIPAEELPHIFDRFYRVDRSRSAATGGRGLGLAIAKAIIVAHRGRIDAASVVGEGTTIRFSLPVATQSPATPQLAPALVGGRRG
jgi:signal transduction histidine kinase